MFNTYSYKTVSLVGIQRNQTYKKNKIKIKKTNKKIDQNEVFTAFTNVYFYFNHDCVCIHLFSVF